jgi:hypothetical protein
LSEPTAATTELEFDARRWINDREYRARYDAQEWERRGPEARAFHEAMQRQSDEREAWIEAGMRQERREEIARRLGLAPRRSGPARVISMATRQPV